MKLQNRPRRPRRSRPNRWKWETIRRMFLAEAHDADDNTLDERARIFTRELNRLDDRTRHNDWRFNQHELLSGLRPGQLDDPTEQHLDCA